MSAFGWIGVVLVQWLAVTLLLIGVVPSSRMADGVLHGMMVYTLVCGAVIGLLFLFGISRNL